MIITRNLFKLCVFPVYHMACRAVCLADLAVSPTETLTQCSVLGENCLLCRTSCYNMNYSFHIPAPFCKCSFTFRYVSQSISQSALKENLTVTLPSLRIALSPSIF